MKRFYSDWIINGLLVLISITFTFVLLEIGYRVYLYGSLSYNPPEFAFVALESPLYRYDEAIGYRYIPNQTLTWRRFNKHNQPLSSNQVQINHLGQVSRTDTPLTKSATEFRIAVMGDSFTASVTNNHPWPSTLETLLNQTAEFKTQLGVSKITVLNFGMDGTGIGQWEAVYQHEVDRFQPDLVIVNFITRDITRPFIWLDTIQADNYEFTLTCNALPVSLTNKACTFGQTLVLPQEILSNTSKLVALKQTLYQTRLNQLAWFSPYPELLAVLVDRSPRLTLSQNRVVSAEAETEYLLMSLKALRFIKTSAPRTLILHLPTLDDLTDPNHQRLFKRLLQEGQDLEIIPMSRFLPAESDSLKQAFNPDDNHFNDYGAELYAQWVQQVVKAELSR